MRLRKLIVLGATAALIIVACFTPARARTDAKFWGHIFDVGHIPLWAWLAAALLYALPRRVQPFARRSAAAFALAVVAAVAVELLQPQFGRSASIGDVVNDVIGAGLALTGLAAWRRSGSRWWRGGHLLAVATGFGIALWPAYEEWRGIRWRQMNFPVVGNFEHEDELKLWLPQGGGRGRPTQILLTRARAVQGERSLRVVGAAGDWAGVSFAAGRQDWRNYRALHFSAFNPREPFTLFVRVDDHRASPQSAGRFEGGFTLAPGWNHVRVPIADVERGTRNRPLNLRAIRRVAFFTGDAEPQRFWFLDNVYLERRDEEDALPHLPAP
jgi:VanZ family protein